MKAISKGCLAGCLIHLDAGSTDRLAQQNLQIPENANKGTTTSWLFDAHLSARDRPTSSRPDAILVNPFKVSYLLENSNGPFEMAIYSLFAPAVTPKTSQQRCMQISQAQCQHEGELPRSG